MKLTIDIGDREHKERCFSPESSCPFLSVSGFGTKWCCSIWHYGTPLPETTCGALLRWSECHAAEAGCNGNDGGRSKRTPDPAFEEAVRNWGG